MNNKIKAGMLTKDTCGGSVKDVDVPKGIVTGYFSIFGNKDSDGDIIMSGAFKKTVTENGPESARPRILHLLQHDTTKPLSRPMVLREDEKGLYFESKISETTYGRDTLKLYQDGVLTEHSIGFNVVKWDIDQEKEIRKIHEIRLWEGSTVSWGANMEAIVTGVKNEDKTQLYDKLIKKLEAMNSAIKGNLTDDTIILLELQIKQLQQILLSLADAEKPASTSSSVDEPRMDVEKAVEIIRNFKF